MAAIKARSVATVLTLLAISIAIASWAWSAGAEGIEGADVAFTGRYRLQWQATSLTGDVDRYHSDTGLDPGTYLRHGLALAGFGRLAGGWSFDGSYDDSLPAPNRLELRLRRAGNELLVGSQRFTAAGPGLLNWGRLLTGVQGTFLVGERGATRVQAAWGAPLGVPVREILPGRGLVGPYLLNQLYLPVIPGTESVRIDDQLLRRQTDYTIDYELGSLTFREPVLETAQIRVEYEYEAPQARRALLGSVGWEAGPIRIDMLAVGERAIGDEDEDPLVFIPPGGEEPNEVPLGSRMHGVAMTWQPALGARLFGSWLSAAAVKDGEWDFSEAWQAGGDWQGEWGKAGFDYRFVPTDFNPIGLVTGEKGAQELLAGYERYLHGPWHSKLNLLWRRTVASLASEGSGQQRARAEHVLSYVTERGLLGWGLGLEQAGMDGQRRRVLTSAVLGSLRVGDWELGMERSGAVARSGEEQPGEPLSSTRLSASLVGSETVSAALQWKQERSSPGGQAPSQATTMRLSAASRATTGAWGDGTGQADWRVHWLHSETQRVGRDSGGNEFVPALVTYGRAEGSVPLVLPGITGTGLLELRSRRSYDGSHRLDATAQVGLRYQSERLQLDSHVRQSRGEVRLSPLGSVDTKWYSARGVELYLPLMGPWAYRGALSHFGEQAVDEEAQGLQQLHGVIWSSPHWRWTMETTSGLLEQPRVDAKEESGEVTPIAGLPQGRRLAVGGEWSLNQGRLSSRIERDWEATTATAWRGEIRGVLKLGGAEVEATWSTLERLVAATPSVQRSGKLAVNWSVSDWARLSISGRTDRRQGAALSSEYEAVGFFGEWTSYF